MSERQCNRCGGTYDEAFFRVDRRHPLNALSGRCAVCIGCELTARTKEKQKDRFRLKASDALRRHAEKYVRFGAADSRTHFSEKFGWEIDRITHDIKHAYQNGCGYCGERFADMGHGLSDITIDIVDPRAPPYYGTNTKLICQTCNREKGRTSPEQWGAKLISWARWKKWSERLKEDPLAWSPLFSWKC